MRNCHATTLVRCLGVSFEFDAAGRLKPLPDEVDALLLEQDALLTERTSQLTERDAQLAEQTVLLERIRALVDAGDLDAVRALLAGIPPREHPD